MTYILNILYQTEKLQSRNRSVFVWLRKQARRTIYFYNTHSRTRKKYYCRTEYYYDMMIVSW